MKYKILIQRTDQSTRYLSVIAKKVQGSVCTVLPAFMSSNSSAEVRDVGGWIQNTVIEKGVKSGGKSGYKLNCDKKKTGKLDGR